MSISSAMQVSLSGMRFASNAAGVYANNLANARTNEFKQSTPVASTQAVQTLEPGSDGQNPSQVGKGVYMSAIQTDHTPGSLAFDITGQTVELSNTRVEQSLIGLGSAKRMVQTGAAVVDAACDMLDALLTLGRR